MAISFATTVAASVTNITPNLVFDFTIDGTLNGNLPTFNGTVGMNVAAAPAIQDLAGNREAAIDDVDQQQWVAVDANPRAGKHDHNERHRQPCATTVPAARRLLRVKPAAVAFLVGRG
jgi:hypothetical protein